ncbi:MAG: PEP/pyruvate-binding domain-containing protein [Bacteriovoracia bacterium]
MKNIGSNVRRVITLTLLLNLIPNITFAAARVMNPGEAKGQLVYLSVDDVQKLSPKFKALSPLSLPVFAELPMDLAVVTGSITLKQQNLLSHVQLKSRARGTPNLDISELDGGLSSSLMKPFKDGDWVRMVLSKDGQILLEKSTEAEATAFYQAKKGVDVKLKADMSARDVIRTEDLSSADADKVGSKAANCGELAKALNTADRTVVRTGFGIPFYFYQEFIDSNPKIKASIEGILRDPLMKRVSKVSYREEKLKALQDLMMAETAVISPALIDRLIELFDKKVTKDGVPRKLKLRSSTNSEDLPNFNGAGLYDSYSYKPAKDGKEKKREKKVAALSETLRKVWASVWNLRAYEERAFFRIPHGDVKMGIQVNPSFSDEGASGVVVTKNVSKDPNLTAPGVYVEAQRGDKFSVMNPESGIKPEKVLILFNDRDPLNVAQYEVRYLQKSNIADDNETILDHDNPKEILSVEQAKDLAYQVMKAHAHFKPIFGADKADFALDLEFKVDSEDNGVPTVFLKQARPYID